MRVVVWGAGRIGQPIAVAAAQAGHRVELLVRKPGGARNKGAEVPLRTLTEVHNWEEVNLLILAVALEDAKKYPTVEAAMLALQWVTGLPASVAVASVIGPLSCDALRELWQGRKVTRFMCSPAVTEASSVRFYDASGNSEANSLIQSALPGPNWRAVPGTQFDRVTSVFVAAAVVCAALSEYKQIIGGNLARDEKEFLDESLIEVVRLLHSSQGDPSIAFEQTATPGGMSRKVFETLFGRAYVALAITDEKEAVRQESEQ